MLPDKNLIVIPREDDLMFGVLSSRFHAAWALRKGSDLEDRPRYTHTSTLATFPFPEGMAPTVGVHKARARAAAPAIEKAAANLDTLRTRWLYPANLVDEQPEIMAGFPSRLVPRDDAARVELAKRTMTALYNKPPEWLREAHRQLDEAVAAAYGWHADIGDDDALASHTFRGVGAIALDAPGMGVLNYDLYLQRLSEKHPNIPVIIEHLDEADAPRSKKFLDDKFRANGV